MSDTAHLRRDLHNETAIATTLMVAIKDSLGQDEEAMQLSLESETHFVEAAEQVIYRLGELQSLVLAIDQQVELIRSRKSRLTLQQNRLRAALASAFDQLGLKRVETPSATLSIRAVPRKAKIVDEAALPAEYWRTPPAEPNKTMINAAVKSGVTIPGVELDNGGQTLQITYS